MRALLHVFEVVSTGTFVSGLLLNLLLLFLIHRFSTKELGTYKYLLQIFAAYDTFLVLEHYAIDVKVIPSRTGFAVMLDRSFGSLWLTCLTSSSYSVPFVLLNIHFLYRYWLILLPYKIARFSSTKFKVLLVAATLYVQQAWFICCLVLGRPEDAEELQQYLSMFRNEYERDALNDGAAIMNYWSNGTLCIRPFLLLVVADFVQIFSFSLAAVLAVLTYREIRRAQNLSDKARDFHLRILAAAVAQTLTPLIFVYTPYLLNINISLFHLYSPNFSALSMVLLSFFPGIDAIVIIVLVRPYREGLLRMICGNS